MSCNLDTTPPNQLPPFARVYRLVGIDGQALPDTLSLPSPSDVPIPHKVEAGTIQFIDPLNIKLLQWTLLTKAVSDSLEYTLWFQAGYVQFGPDSLAFPTSRTLPPEFFGRRRGDSLTIVTIWTGEAATPAVLVGGSHTFWFVRDSSASP